MLIADKDNNSFRQKIVFKFTPKLNPVKTSKRGEKNMDKPVSIKRLLLPIPAKSPKEVKEISKFFKATNLTYGNEDTRKSYVQVSQSANNTRKILKIKKAFPNLQTNKIEYIQKIIKDNGKPKPKINMITKGLSRKYVIVPISNDNKTKFMKNSSTHVTNINRVLKDIKSEVIADFIHPD